MLSKKQRLNLGKEQGFSVFYSKSTLKFSTEHFRVFSKKAENFKAAVVIPKKMVSQAVARNRLKRKIYESLRVSKLFNMRIEIVLILKKREVEEQDVDEEISKIYKKINEKNYC